MSTVAFPRHFAGVEERAPQGVVPGHQVADVGEEEAVLFVIGMRVNRWRRVRSWLPVVRAMPGMLAELVTLPEAGVVPMAASLDFAQAACLPCAGVTAWNALYEGPRALVPGMRVLVLGSGGVSMLALQLARAGGCEVIATSSSDDKLKRVRELGAAHTVNYKTTPEWGPFVGRELGGVDKVVEVGGAGTAEQSMAALRTHGEVALIGVLQPEGGPNPRGLMMTAGTMRGIFVGSAAMAKALNAAIDVNGIKPVIGKSFGFDQAKEAYAHAWGPDSFAKTVIELV